MKALVLSCLLLLSVFGTYAYTKSNTLSDMPQVVSYEDKGRVDVNPPNDVMVNISPGFIVLSWTTVPNAISYIVEGSGRTEIDFTDVTSQGSFTIAGNTVNWSVPIQARCHFYRIKSFSFVYPPNFVLVEGGTFHNGVSNVTVSSLYIDQYELTQSAYQAVMGVNPAYFSSVPNGPVERVSWYDAIEYCNLRSIAEGLNPCYSYLTYGTNPPSWPTGWNTYYLAHTEISCNWTANGYRLLTEAEWHFAARGGNLTQGYIYSGSNDLETVSWFLSNAGTSTHTVGTKSANELGLFDMSGNVWEWTWDIYGVYPSGVQFNPHGAVSGDTRIVRGGSWGANASSCTVTRRYTGDATYKLIGTGFRICRIRY